MGRNFEPNLKRGINEENNISHKGARRKGAKVKAYFKYRCLK